MVLVDPGRQVPGYCQALAEALAATGIDLDFVTAPLLHYAAETSERFHTELRFGRLLGPEGSRLRRLAERPAARRLLRGLGYPFELVGFLRAMRRRRPDLIHVQWSLWPGLDALAVAALRRGGLPLVYTVHNSLPHEPRPWHRWSYRRLYARADRLIVHTEASRARLARFVGPLSVPVEVVPMPADPVAPAGDRRAARRRLGLAAQAPLLLFLGHARPYKGLDLLLKAWPGLHAQLPEARLLIAGAPPRGAKALAALTARIRAAAPDGSIDWRPGYLPREAVADCFAAADLVALPYRDSDHSAVLTAARGYGRAVLATAVGGLPEALAGGGGRLVPPEDPSALTEALVALLSDPDARATLEAEALAAARAWTWTDAARATRAVYDRAGMRHAAAPPPEDRPDAAPPPFVSVILPVRDEEAQIEAAIRPFLAGDHPIERMELLVVDGGSRDGTRARVEALAATLPPGRLRLLDNPEGSTPAGLNIGLAAARGEVVLRMDGHAQPAEDYVTACLAALRRTGAWAVGGAMRGRGETDFGRAAALATAHPLGAGDAAFRLGRAGWVDTVYLGAWPRARLEQLGGFDEGLPRNQDYELCLRIRAAGGRIWLDPAIRSTTLSRGSPTALLRQYHGYGRGRAATLRRHPGSLRWRQALPALWLALLLLGPPAALAWPGLRGPLALALAAYGLALVGSTWQLGRGASWRVAGWLPLAFVCIHLAWGTGFWRGLAGEALGRRRPGIDPGARA